MLFDKKRKTFLSKEDTETILTCIRKHEQLTSGEIRICIESKCSYMDPIDRAHELFHQLKMYNTVDKNAVLIYIAHKDHDFALLGDGGIFRKANTNFWQKERKRLSYHFFHHEYLEGIMECIEQVCPNTLFFVPESLGFTLTSPPRSIIYTWLNSLAINFLKPSNALPSIKLLFVTKDIMPLSVSRSIAQR